MARSNTNALSKLRSACDHCHYSKVRCTGEQSGCRRCKHGRRKCHYSASNVGKTPGNRVHKQMSTTSEIQVASFRDARAFEQLVSGSPSLAHNLDLWTPMHSEDAQDQTLDNSVSSMKDNEPLVTESPSLAHNLDFWTLMHSEDTQDLNLDNSVSTTKDTGPLDDAICVMDGFPNTEELSEMDFLATPESQPGVPLQTPIHSQVPSQPRTGSVSTTASTFSSISTDQGSTAELTLRINELSQKLLQSPLALDEVLSTNTFYLQIIESSLMDLSTDPSRMSTILMMIICLTQVLALFEECVGRGTETALFDMTNGPILLLGSFQVDVESQRQIRIKIVLKELTRILAVAGGLGRALQQQPVAVGSQNQTYRTLLTDVRKRVQFLAQIVKNA
ncbi:unnamed protein product [Periconia digitata]|uniref:Zn(2)-C6 fungal-type domain-containing protein n=1 Tax=Periconia digitata TaxID=1303443 RepID=A0A9W4U3Q7_9PLEO|nr:unnamed protein product [Periconia digitata]